MLSTAQHNGFTQTRAINSASSVGRRKLCPGSAKAEKEAIEVADEQAQKYSDKGVLLHYHDEHPEVSREDLTEGERQVLELNKWLRDKFMAMQLAQLGIPADARHSVFAQREFFLCGDDGLPIEPLVPGHPDWIYYYAEHKIAFIFDSKFGRIEVPAAECNDQLRTYAVQFSDEYFCAKVYCAITQPWVAAPNNFHAVEYDETNLPFFKKELIDIINGTLSEDAPRRPSIEACRYCKAKIDCPESIKETTELAVLKISDITIPELEELGEQMERAQAVILAWERRMKYVAETRPDLLKKYHLKPGAIKRVIPDAKKAYTLLMDAGGLLADDTEQAGAEFASCCKVSPHELEVLVARNRKITGKDAKAKLKMALGDQMQEKQNQPSLEKIIKAKR